MDTGSTNYTKGGIFGQSNVGHVIRDKAIAQAYLDYWEALAEDPRRPAMRTRTPQIHPDLSGMPPKGMSPIFSPRPDLTMLGWYGERLQPAKQSVHLTAAFGVGGLKDYLSTPAGGCAACGLAGRQFILYT